MAAILHAAKRGKGDLRGLYRTGSAGERRPSLRKPSTKAARKQEENPLGHSRK